MPAAGDPIFELPDKVRMCCQILHDDGTLIKATQARLADYCGISLDTLKDCLRSDNHRMSSQLQRQFANKAGFSVHDPAWIDRHACGRGERRDTAAHFDAMLRRRRAGSISLRLRSSRPELLDRNLAVFDVSDAQPGSADEILVFFEGNFYSGVARESDGEGDRRITGEVVYGFRRIRLALDLGENSEIHATNHFGYIEAAKLGGAELRCCGSQHYPQWFLEIEDGALEGPFLTQEHPLVAVVGGALGGKLTARISVQLRDSAVHVTKDGKPACNRNVGAVLQRLRALRLTPGATETHGWIDLGVQEIEIVGADR